MLEGKGCETVKGDIPFALKYSFTFAHHLTSSISPTQPELATSSLIIISQFFLPHWKKSPSI